MLKTEHIELALYEGSDLVSYLTTYNETMEKLDESIYDLQSKLTAEELTGANLAEIVKKLQSNLENAESQIETLINKCGELDLNILNNTSSINELQTELTTTNATVKTLLSKIDDVSEKITNIETELNNTTDRLHTEIQDLAKELEDFVSEQTSKNSQLQKDIDTVVTKCNNLESVVNQISASLSTNNKIKVKNIPASSDINFSYSDLEFSAAQQRGLVGLVISQSLETPISAFDYGAQPHVSLVDSASSDFDITVGNQTVMPGVVSPIITGNCNSDIALITIFIGD